MAHYRVYLLDDRNKIVNGVDLICVDDHEAVTQARLQAESQSFEVWQSTRRVFPDVPRPNSALATLNTDRKRPPSLARFIQELLLVS